MFSIEEEQCILTMPDFMKEAIYKFVCAAIDLSEYDSDELRVKLGLPPIT